MPEIAEASDPASAQLGKDVRIAVIWIDWYLYHAARFRALLARAASPGQVIGVELVGEAGVHAGYKFREDLPSSLPVQTLFPRSAWQDVSSLQLARAVWSRLPQLQPNLLLVPGYYTLPAIAAAVWAKLHRCSTVLMTETGAHDHPRIWWREFFKGLIIRILFDWAVSGGKPHQRYLIRLGFPPQRIARFYDVVDNEFYLTRTTALRNQFTSADFGLPEHYFLYVGRLAKEKNLHTLISAYIDYREAGGSWSLVLTGDGPDLSALRALADSSRYGEDIYFEGLKKSVELPQYYAFAGCFVLPSSREPWGLVVNEALASGLPAIVSRNCGCADDLIEYGSNGLLFDPANSSELAACLASIAGSNRPSLVRMGARSLEIISRFSPQAWAAEVVRIAEVEAA